MRTAKAQLKADVMVMLETMMSLIAHHVMQQDVNVRHGGWSCGLCVCICPRSELARMYGAREEIKQTGYITNRQASSSRHGGLKQHVCTFVALLLLCRTLQRCCMLLVPGYLMVIILYASCEHAMAKHIELTGVVHLSCSVWQGVCIAC